MTYDDMRHDLTSAQTLIQGVKDRLGVTTEVRAGENLQAALDNAGVITLETGTTWEGTYQLRSDTTLLAPYVQIRGKTAPALLIPPGTDRVTVEGLMLTTEAREVMVIGANDTTQTHLDQVPSTIILRDLRITDFRGKRGLYIHGRDVRVEDSVIENVWDPLGQDSQAVCVGNTPGPVSLVRCRLSAGSEVFLSGGDTFRIPGIVPNGILLDSCILHRPLSWRTDGSAGKRKIKNIFEIKNGRGTIVRDSILAGCWIESNQASEALMITPAQNGIVENVLFQRCRIYDCGSILSATGYDYVVHTPVRTTGIVIEDCVLEADHTRFGGRGQLATLQNGMGSVTFRRNVVRVLGSSTIYYQQGSVMNADGTKRPGGLLGPLKIADNIVAQIGVYGFNLGGNPNTKDWQKFVETLTVTGNTFTGSTSMAMLLPDNVWST